VLAGSRMLSIVNFTAAESTGSPFSNVRPGLSRSARVVSEVYSQLWARYGMIDPSSSRKSDSSLRTWVSAKGSETWGWRGSSVTGSTPMAITTSWPASDRARAEAGSGALAGGESLDAPAPDPVRIARLAAELAATNLRRVIGATDEPPYCCTNSTSTL